MHRHWQFQRGGGWPSIHLEHVFDGVHAAVAPLDLSRSCAEPGCQFSVQASVSRSSFTGCSGGVAGAILTHRFAEIESSTFEYCSASGADALAAAVAVVECRHGHGEEDDDDDDDVEHGHGHGHEREQERGDRRRYCAHGRMQGATDLRHFTIGGSTFRCNSINHSTARLPPVGPSGAGPGP